MDEEAGKQFCEYVDIETEKEQGNGNFLFCFLRTDQTFTPPPLTIYIIEDVPVGR